MTEWLKKNWLKATLTIFATGGWVAWVQYEVQAASKHRKDSCIRWCIQDCLETCRLHMIPATQCNCNHCYQKCGN